MRGSGRFVAVALAVSAMLAGTAQAATLKITSSAFKEGGMISAKYASHLVTKRDAGTATDCGGQNVSPALSWTNVPDGTKSFGLVIYDPDGAKGGGAVHWIAYGIAGDLRSLPEGFGNKTTGYVGGTGAAGNHDYMGPCPTPGHTNHYIFSLYALDLAPDALQPGLTRDQFLDAVKSHVLDNGSLVGRAPSRLRSP
jgi:Raf kinase inhibitor-like YbhB/YbcL family protein